MNKEPNDDDARFPSKNDVKAEGAISEFANSLRISQAQVGSSDGTLESPLSRHRRRKCKASLALLKTLR